MKDFIIENIESENLDFEVNYQTALSLASRKCELQKASGQNTIY